MDILRGERLSEFSSNAANYTSSIDSDKFLISSVIKINKAHMLMLIKKRIIDLKEGYGCIQALEDIPEDISMNSKLEDVHMNIEALVVKKVGETIGGQLNLAKSRNDQVATAIRMVLRDFILNIASSLNDLRKVILQRCEENLKTVMPGYTHLQHAQPITLAHHLLAHHDALTRDNERLMESYGRVNLSPMGACALATTGFKIDRSMVSELLGFDGIVENSIDAVSTRDFAIEVISDLAMLMTDLSRFSEELVLWSTYEFSIAEMPDEYSSTSSIMPQKKNPIVAELIRAKTSKVYGNLLTSLSILKSLTYSYNLDLQELTPNIWDSCQIALSTINVFKNMLEKVKFNEKRLLELVKSDMSVATELADALVREQNIPFRTSHRIVGNLVKRALSDGKSLDQAVKEDLNDIIKDNTGKSIIISEEVLRKVLDPIENVKIRSIKGGPSPNEVLRMVKERWKALKNYDEWILERRESLNFADDKLAKEILSLKEMVKA
ncbi:MAG: argininosuccinate lyase [archaeon]|nr:argininosuccinate lyase [archaeon]MCP8313466.1 argininosuccinate lyase [archaeon]MCP8317909.1 argininosuccinate lyase [archaeon]